MAGGKRGAVVQQGRAPKDKVVNHAKRVMLMKRPPPSLHEVSLREAPKRGNNRSMVDAWFSSIESSEVLDLEMSEWLGEDVPAFHKGINVVAPGLPSCTHPSLEDELPVASSPPAAAHAEGHAEDDGWDALHLQCLPNSDGDVDDADE
eukprot:gene14996-17726_t